MGLMYAFPVAQDEEGFYIKKDDTITLKTYGLPYIFWIYAFCTIAVIIFMLLGIKEPVLKLVRLGDETDALLGYSLLSFVGILPVLILGFFFYEKRIIKKDQELRLVHKIFGITVFSENFPIKTADDLFVDSFLASPNMARRNSSQENMGFQNKGYFVLWLKIKDGKTIQIDRHSRKADLEKLAALIIN